MMQIANCYGERHGDSHDLRLNLPIRGVRPTMGNQGNGGRGGGGKLKDNRRILAGSWLIALLAVAVVACSSPAAAPDEAETTAAEPAYASSPATIPSAKAAEYIGDKGTVCGPVANTRNEVARTVVVYGSGGAVYTEISLDFDEPFPNQTFLVVIYPDDEKNFDKDPERLVEFYKDKEVCATGRIDTAFGIAFIRAYEQSQIEVMQ